MEAWSEVLVIIYCRGNGERVSEKRMRIYTALLQHMAPEHLISTSSKLCTEILGGASDGLLNIMDPCAQCVIEVCVGDRPVV